jgi:AraC-like DNA-binding protein
MTDLVRSASLTSFASHAAECGLDPRALVAEIGLPARCLDEPDLMIPAGTVGRLLELAASRGRDPGFGLCMAEARRLSNLGPLGLLVRDEPTLRHVLDAVVRNVYLHNEALSVQIEKVGNLVSIRTSMHAEGGPYRQAIELVVGVLHRTLCIFMGAEWRPRLVCFSHRAPGNIAAHRRLFGAAVEFGHEFNGIVCNAADLDIPNPGADPVMSHYTHQLLKQTSRKRPTVSGHVRELIVLLLPRGHCRVEVAAQHLGVNRRTVARQLGAEGTTFTELVAGVRRDLLTQYLKENERTLREVSALLGFSDPTAFARWHRNEYGVTVGSRRDRVGSIARRA